MITFSLFLSFSVYLSSPSLSLHAVVVVLHTEVNLMWAGHQTHHSSEDYNLVTALRQSAVHRYVGWVRELPLLYYHCIEHVLLLLFSSSFYIAYIHVHVFSLHSFIVDIYIIHVCLINRGYNISLDSFPFSVTQK